jgi:hypothetical protein
LTLANTFSLNCYTKIEGPGLPGEWKRIAIRLPSLWRLPEELLAEYDVVVLDEAGLLRRFFGSELMNHKIQQTYDRLCVIVQNAPSVIVMQWQLTCRDVGFFAAMKGLSLDDPAINSIRFRPIEPVPVLLNISRDQGEIEFRLMSYLAKHGNSKRVLVTSSSSALVTLLAMIISRKADEGLLGSLTSSMVKLVTANTLTDSWVSAFLEAPNTAIAGAQVILCSPTLQAGHSLDHVVDKQFIFLMLGVLSHTDEAQQILRARNPGDGRDAFIQESTAGRLCADFEVQLSVASTMTNDPLMQAVLADIHAENNDTQNRHHWKFCIDKEMWRLEPVVRPEDADEYEEYDKGLKLYKKERTVFKKTGQATMLSMFKNAVDVDTVTLVERQNYKGMLKQWPLEEKQQFAVLWSDLFGSVKPDPKSLQTTVVYFEFLLPSGHPFRTRSEHRVFKPKKQEVDLLAALLTRAFPEPPHLPIGRDFNSNGTCFPCFI